ncbi:uncharacterized protein METZ01_LOCUS24339 [marine metagenome]|uniref:Heavy metal binding domain-containing protein n=1 Tax=marine metagenome TaxID=408172 RepID=A0A381PWU0_9ZZZZ
MSEQTHGSFSHETGTLESWRNRRLRVLGVVVALCFATLPISAFLQQSPPAILRSASEPFIDETTLPNIAWTCPMHPEVHELHDDTSCPICNMRLVETRRVAAWTCPVHSVIFERGEGVCPIDGERLVRMNLSLAWTCPEHPEIDTLNPGLCPIDRVTRLVQRLSPLPHEDHTPKHGGIFFMAPDNWHHIEGVYPGAGRIAVYVYDNYSQPISAEAVHGRIVLEEQYDVEANEVREVVAYPLAASSDETYLEAQIGNQELPLEVVAKVRFDGDATEDRFDFVFTSHGQENASPSGSELDLAGPLQPTSDSSAALSPSSIDALLAVAIPGDPKTIVREIVDRNSDIRKLLEAGMFTEIYIPALQAKELALGLGSHMVNLASDRQVVVTLAVKSLVRSAWLLDWYGDLGNRPLIQEAYSIFETAVNHLRAAYEIQ